MKTDHLNPWQELALVDRPSVFLADRTYGNQHNPVTPKLADSHKADFSRRRGKALDVKKILSNRHCGAFTKAVPSCN